MNPRRLALTVSLLLLLGYLTISFGVQHAFPFYAFDMYSHRPPNSASRLYARTADGEVDEIHAFAHWHCDPLPDPVSKTHMQACGNFEQNSARDHESIAWVTFHAAPGPAAKRVDLIRRVWKIGPEGATVDRDCFLQTCQAER